MLLRNRGSRTKRSGYAFCSFLFWLLRTQLPNYIKENILFGAPYDEVRYTKVIKQCALERDLTLFDAGDKTEVGEKGITLRCV